MTRGGKTDLARCFWAIMGAACTTSATVGDPPVPPQACVEVTVPPRFVANSSEPVVQDLKLSNPCDGRAQILAFELEDPAGVFSVGAPTTDVIEPGAEVLVPVSFDPVRRGMFGGWLEVVTDGGPTEAADLQAQALGPAVAVSPVRVELGAVPLVCPTEVELVLTNEGEQAAQVVEVRVDGDPAWSLRDGPWESAGLAAGAELTVAITVAPDTAGPHAAQVTVVTADPRQQDQLVDLWASAEPGDLVEQQWRQLPARDVVVAVDRSCSMAEEAAELLDELPNLVSRAAADGIDLHLAITVGDAGCVAGPLTFIDESFSASDARSALRTMVDWDRYLVPYGSNTERPLALLEASLSDKNLDAGGCNRGLVREDAELHLISVTDGPGGGFGWPYYREVFAERAGGIDRLTHHAISSPRPAGCDGEPPAAVLADATSDTGGVFASICDPIGRGVEAIADRAVGWTRPADRREYLVEQPVVPSTLAVLVDDVPAAGWTYDPSTNAVIFEPTHTPPPRATVTARFAAVPDCTTD